MPVSADRAPGAPSPLRVLFVCTANRCRSPLAAAVFARAAAQRGALVATSSAGLLASGFPALPEMVAAARGIGIDLSAHRSHRMRAADLDVDLVIGMERLHVREVAVLSPTALGRAFTFRELARRLAAADPRRAAVPASTDLAELSAERALRDLLGNADEDDIADPAGGTPEDYAAAVLAITDCAARCARLLFSSPATLDEDA